ncbi:hypothetical protein CF651_30610 [Paenibacillus rigui]|uniref:Integrase catalytic domain-containing protein n=1 Tax=Paenibacillus rigui TaxID=554312 RepID=A0A229UGN7_9BACL|nr:hypothetical protein CF651_30610 [Paenibacillus rigui]
MDYLELLEKEGVQVSMDGRGRATDNSRTERYFRSLKYEYIFLNEFEDPRALHEVESGRQPCEAKPSTQSLRSFKPFEFVNTRTLCESMANEYLNLSVKGDTLCL